MPIDFQKSYNLLTKYVQFMVAHICVNSCFQSLKETTAPKEPGITDKHLPLLSTVATMRSLKLTLLTQMKKKSLQDVPADVRHQSSTRLDNLILTLRFTVKRNKILLSYHKTSSMAYLC
jgi:hypothetical protein